MYYTGHDFFLTFLLAGLLCTTQVMIFSHLFVGRFIVYDTGHDFSLTFLLAGLLCTTQVIKTSLSLVAIISFLPPTPITIFGASSIIVTLGSIARAGD